MQRLKDIATFGVWMLGLGYVAMWAATGPLYRTVAVDLHPETLSPLLHFAGGTAAVLTCVRLVSLLRRRSQAAEGEPAPRPRRRFRRPDPTVQRIKSRDHFGLRGVQH